MDQLTIRGFDADLERQIRKTADALGTSLNKAALHLLRKGSGLEKDPGPQVIGHRLDHLFADWSEAEEREFLDAIRGLDERLAGRGESIVDLLAMPGAEDIEFEPARLERPLIRPADLR